MRELRTKKVMNVVLVAVLLFGMTSVAVADDFTSSPTGPVTTTTTVAVWVAAVHGEGPWDKNSNGCNVGNATDALSVTASITSSDTAVATVDPSTMTFGACNVSQNLLITVVHAVCNTTATVTIAEASVAPNTNAVKGVFNTETIIVNSAGTTPTDPSCTGTTPGPGTCSEPAAPAWAAALLKATSLKAKATTIANYISSVAKHMGPGTDFDTIPKSAQGTGTGDQYPTAVRNYMVSSLGLSSLASVSDARVIRPGWDCTT